MDGEAGSVAPSIGHLGPTPCGASGYGRCFSVRPAAEQFRLPPIRDSAKHLSQRPASDLRARPAAVTGHPKSVRPVATVSFLLHISNAAATDVLQDWARKQGKRAKERNEKEAARLKQMIFAPRFPCFMESHLATFATGLFGKKALSW